MKHLQLFENFSLKSLKTMVLDGDFDNAMKELKNSKDYYKMSFPSEVLEKKHGVSGISKQYNMPFGLDEEELENLMLHFMEDADVITVLFNELLKINQELKPFKDIPFKDGDVYKKSSFIGGVCSRMLIEDVDDYINKETRIDKYDRETKHYTFKRVDEEYSEVYSDISSKGIEVGYFPSLDTLKKIQSSI